MGRKRNACLFLAVAVLGTFAHTAVAQEEEQGTAGPVAGDPNDAFFYGSRLKEAPGGGNESKIERGGFGDPAALLPELPVTVARSTLAPCTMRAPHWHNAHEVVNLMVGTQAYFYVIHEDPEDKYEIIEINDKTFGAAPAGYTHWTSNPTCETVVVGSFYPIAVNDLKNFNVPAQTYMSDTLTTTGVLNFGPSDLKPSEIGLWPRNETCWQICQEYLGGDTDSDVVVVQAENTEEENDANAESTDPAVGPAEEGYTYTYSEEYYADVSTETTAGRRLLQH